MKSVILALVTTETNAMILQSQRLTMKSVILVPSLLLRPTRLTAIATVDNEIAVIDNS